MSDRPPKSASSHPPDAPATPEELEAAERLRNTLEDPALASPDVVSALRAAWSPSALDDASHAAILADLPASDEEARLAAELRDALAGNGATKDAELVGALHAAYRPTTLDDAEHRRIIDRAVAPKTADVITLRRPRRVAVTVTATSVLALAAGVLLFLTTSRPPDEVPLAKARSTQPLFGEPFKAGETSARIDRIALARAADYRDNRFVKWGVK